MTALLILISIILIGIIIVQVGRVSDLAGRIRGEEDQQQESNRINASLSLIFVIVFLAGTVVCHQMFKNDVLWYGPHVSASEHGSSLDYIFNITTVVTGIVFVITQILLFWFSYKYKEEKGRKAYFMPHDNKLEIIWTAIPAVVMTFLVVGGLDAWNTVMGDVEEGEDHIEIHAMGMQFAWMMRYPGPDGLLGTTNYKLISPTNPMGQDWTDPKNHDDIVSTSPGEVIKLPIDQLVRVRISARDVLHNFDLPHFRVKMDAIPGLPTVFKFKPTVTTEQYRKNLGATDKEGNPLYPAQWEPMDPEEPDGPMRWEAFQYELACAELCGNGHYSMRRIVDVVSQEEYDEWYASQQSYYETTIKGTDDDPYKLDPKAAAKKAFTDAVNEALKAEDDAGRTLRLDNVKFATGSAQLTESSTDELNNLLSILDAYPEMRIEIAGHTDNVGNPQSNQTLSASRAASVVSYLTQNGVNGARLVSNGYGDTVPVADNATEEGRKQNRRTEFKILK